MDNILKCFEKISKYYNTTSTTSSTSSTLNPNILNNNDDNEHVIDIQKTFSSANIDIIPIIKKILKLESDFPDNILKTHKGHKYSELEFFSSNLDSNISSDVKSIFQHLDYTITQTGQYLLKNILLNPITSRNNINQLFQRQNIIKTLTESPYLIENIRDAIRSIAKLERDVLSMSLPDTPEMKEVYNLIYFNTPILNKLNYNDLFMKFLYYFIIIFSPFYGIVSPFVFIFVPFLFMKFIMKLPITFDIFWVIVKNMFMGGSGFFTMLNKMFQSPIGQLGQFGGSSNNSGDTFNFRSFLLWFVKLVIGFMASPYGNYIYLGFIGVSYIYGIYNSIQISIMYNKVINMLHSRLNIITEWLKTCKKLYDKQICFNCMEIQTVIHKINQLLDNPIIKTLLTHGTFKHEPGIISNKGIIIKTFKLFLDSKEQVEIFMEPFSHYLAYVDMFSSIGLWLNKYKNQAAFCKFDMDSKYPYITGKSIWNICCGNNTICNDINLGILQTSISEPQSPINKPSNNNNASNVCNVSNVSNASNASNVCNVSNASNASNIGDTSDASDVSNVGDASNVSNVSNVGDASNVSNVGDASNVSNVSNIGDTSDASDVSNVDDASNVSNVSNIGDTSNASDVSNFSNASNVGDRQIPKIDEQQKGVKELEIKTERFTNMLITGPNGSGKSTYIKSVIECILLGQTIGIVPAKEITFTLFNNISTYLNIPDCQGKESLFQAEMNRCLNQLEMLENAEKNNEFSFTIMDEIFVSTNYQEGMSGAYAIINQMEKFPKCLNIITTHYDVLANMKELHVDKQYFDIEINNDAGKQIISKDYKIKPGVSKKHMALQLLKEKGFNPEIIKDAEYLYEKLTNQTTRDNGNTDNIQNKTAENTNKTEENDNT